MMIAMQDGSTHTLCGDMVRRHHWGKDFPDLESNLGGTSEGKVSESFTVVLTNPPFGQNLKVSASDCKLGSYTISEAASGKDGKHVALEIGLVYLELAYRLLQIGGRVGIVLPETYFFSHSYRWLPRWLEKRMELRGMMHIPMEAFEEFCRAKTNFYIFEKVGHGIDEGEE
jgi:type I restriction enzyme M protein